MRKTTVIPLFQIDAFTAASFKGNPAAVCLTHQPLDAPLMQQIAAEMNLSETAFLTPLDGQEFSESSLLSLRWFTPATEVPLCGHATLASAAVLFDEYHSSAAMLTFRTLSGDLNAERTDQGIRLNFPMDMPVECVAPADVIEALGLKPADVVHAAWGESTHKLLLRLGSPDQVKDLRPDFAALLRSSAMTATYRGLIVTAAGDSPYDFVSRFFAPWVGINEDPVTGSAHTLLTPYWAQRLSRDTLFAYQASARGGELHVRARDDHRVEITGRAVVIFAAGLRL